ncbi:MAG: cell division protein FtsZ [Bacteroidaceae bacterium]
MTDNIKPLDGWNLPTTNHSIIKVIGVGGGGGNAVNHMYKEGFHDVTFVVCNTDRQALEKSEVPLKIEIGEGLGVGAKPDKAEQYATESEEKLRQMLDDNTKMVFITAGMGGGTGTGAAPVVARIAKEMGILTVGIVTIPFFFEGKKKISMALKGVDRISKHVDALLVINNERLRDIYADYTFSNAFGKADDTLSIAAKSIAEIITQEGIVNLDFEDVKTTIEDGGVAIMSVGYGDGKEGEGRITRAINEALNSPLLNNNDVFEAKRILLNLVYSKDSEPKMEEFGEIHDFMEKFSDDVKVIWGAAEDDSLGEKLKMTILATGFGLKDVTEAEKPKIKTPKDISNEEEDIDVGIRIQEIYGKNKGKTPMKRPNIFLFKPEDLTNEEIISLVESTPTYKRDKSLINLIRRISGDLGSTSNEENEQSTTITF